ncbi:dsRBD fold-containing protein [Streptomyces tateyamensis]|uniref:dsRBD fold-containing protein n=1 Tax=Streptomyces tateyamensis TaxID=565073 RepID=UPI003CCC8D30
MNERTATETRTKQWTLRLDLFEEGDTTKVHAVLDTGDNTLQSHTSARRNPHDTPVPEIGDEYAAGRALVDLGRQLLRAGRADSWTDDPTPHD